MLFAIVSRVKDTNAFDWNTPSPTWDQFKEIAKGQVLHFFAFTRLDIL
jgi:hypothetical protein